MLMLMEQEDLLVSVIIPCYNVENFVEVSLKSVLKQTYRNLEIIIINDGSTDRTLEILEEFKRLDSRISLISQENKGQSVARNKGISLASGKYLCFIDSDDFIQQDMIEVLLIQALKEGSDIISCGVRRYNLKKDSTTCFPLYTDSALIQINNYTQDNVMGAFLKGEGFNRGPVATLYCSSLFDGIRFETGRLHEDNFFNYQMFSKAQKATAIAYDAYFYVDNFSSSTKSKFTLRHIDKITEEQKILKEVLKHYPHYKNVEKNNLAVRYCWVFTKLFRDSTIRELLHGKVRYNIEEIKKYYKEDEKEFFKSGGVSLKWRFLLKGFTKLPALLLLPLYKIIISILKVFSKLKRLKDKK